MSKQGRTRVSGKTGKMRKMGKMGKTGNRVRVGYVEF